MRCRGAASELEGITNAWLIISFLWQFLPSKTPNKPQYIQLVAYTEPSVGRWVSHPKNSYELGLTASPLRAPMDKVLWTVEEPKGWCGILRQRRRKRNHEQGLRHTGTGSLLMLYWVLPTEGVLGQDFGHCQATCAVASGVLYSIAEFTFTHCADAQFSQACFTLQCAPQPLVDAVLKSFQFCCEPRSPIANWTEHLLLRALFLSDRRENSLHFTMHFAFSRNDS